MSLSYHLNCVQCRKAVWPGRNVRLNVKDDEAMEELSTFLFKHVGHPLVFANEWDERYADYPLDNHCREED